MLKLKSLLNDASAGGPFCRLTLAAPWIIINYFPGFYRALAPSNNALYQEHLF